MERTNEITLAVATMWSAEIQKRISQSLVAKDEAIFAMNDLLEELRPRREEFMCNALRDLIARSPAHPEAPIAQVGSLHAVFNALKSMLEHLGGEESEFGHQPLDCILATRHYRDTLRIAYENRDIHDQIQWRIAICKQVIDNLQGA